MNSLFCLPITLFTDLSLFALQALLLKPQSATTYTAIGFIHALLGNLDPAIEYFHKSLALNRDCIVTSTILKNCIEDLMDDASTINEICSKALREVTESIAISSRNQMANVDKLNGIKTTNLRFEDEEEVSNSNSNSNSNQSASDSNMVVDMSFDT